MAPLIVGEVLSRSTALHDRNTRKAHYERMGVQFYWLLDPTEPGYYEQVAHVEGDAEFVAERPFPITIGPARLLDGLRP